MFIGTILCCFTHRVLYQVISVWNRDTGEAYYQKGHLPRIVAWQLSPFIYPSTLEVQLQTYFRADRHKSSTPNLSLSPYQHFHNSSPERWNDRHGSGAACVWGGGWGGAPCRVWRYLPPACVLLRLQFIRVTDMTEPVALALRGVLSGFGGSPVQMCIFQSSARRWMNRALITEVYFAVLQWIITSVLRWLRWTHLGPPAVVIYLPV